MTEHKKKLKNEFLGRRVVRGIRPWRESFWRRYALI